MENEVEKKFTEYMNDIATVKCKTLEYGACRGATLNLNLGLYFPNVCAVGVLPSVCVAERAREMFDEIESDCKNVKFDLEMVGINKSEGYYTHNASRWTIYCNNFLVKELEYDFINKKMVKLELDGSKMI